MQPKRRSYSKSFKAQVIQECAQPGASMACIALSHRLNANLVHKWIRLQTQNSTALQPAFIPLAPVPESARRNGRNDDIVFNAFRDWAK
ncbi:transposase [Pseudomonas atacamensis]|uniref:Transposase n=1 Tax=Pseudomonas atacamensis TaxID=2565368 RepID=A0AAQ2HYB6_9PSED|nr:transposase [Pseudomonas atacamensis]THF25812.1 transposase [Pseudomonas atacamensis]